MRVNALFFLTIVACTCLALASRGSVGDCCLTYGDKKARIQKYAVKYRLQELDGDCNLEAVIFIMRRGRKMCTDPREKWVKDLMTDIDKRKMRKHYKPHMKHNFRG